MPPSSATRSRRVGRNRSFLLGASAFVVVVGMQIPTLGMGRLDNNDWLKYASSFVSHPVGLPAVVAEDEGTGLWRERYEGKWLRYWQSKPVFEQPTSWWDTGSIFLLWLPAASLMRWCSPEPVLDLLLLGVPLRLGLVFGFVLLARALARRAPPGRMGAVTVGGVLSALAASSLDVGNLSYFNSFFREGAAQVFALWLVVLLTGSGEEIARRRWWLGAVVVLLLTSATVHSALVPALVILWLTLAGRQRRLLVGPLSLGVIVALVFNVLAVNPHTSRNAAYHGLFFGLLEQSARPAEHVEWLGLPETALGRLGHRAFDSESQALIDSYPEVFRHSNVLGVAIREPLAMVRLLAAAIPALGSEIGYLPRVQRGAPRHVWWLSDAPRFFLLRHSDLGLEMLITASSLALFAVWVLWRGGGSWPVTLARLTLTMASMAWLELAGNVLGDGLSATGRHLFLARLALDQALIFGFALVVTVAYGVLVGHREKRAGASADRLATPQLASRASG